MRARKPVLRALALVLLLVTMPGLAGERYGWLGVRIRDLSESETEDLSVKRGVREGRRREVAIRVGAMPDDAVADRVAAEFGFLVREPSGEESPAAGGARLGVVGAVLERSAAARAGLAVGDRILAVNGVATDSAEAVRRELREARLRETLRLRVERRGEPHDLALPPVERALPSQ
jgi:S1-C subfamily serine protease